MTSKTRIGTRLLDPSPTFRPRNDIANSRPPVPSTSADDPAWKETLSRLPSTTEQTPAIRSAALPPGHELVYVVDIQASPAGNGLVLEVADTESQEGRRVEQTQGPALHPE